MKKGSLKIKFRSETSLTEILNGFAPLEAPGETLGFLPSTNPDFSIHMYRYITHHVIDMDALNDSTESVQ